LSCYPPTYHLEDDHQRLTEVIDRFDFATLITRGQFDEDLRITQIPLMPNQTDSGQFSLLGHMHAANPQCAALRDGQSVTALFQGPHAYISPMDYHGDHLPTWNYITVEARGTVVEIESTTDKAELMVRLTDHMEQRRPGSGERFDLRTQMDRVHRLLDAIHCFELTHLELIGRFKLSQDKSAEDFRRAAEHLIEADRQHHEDWLRAFVLNEGR